MQFRTVLLLGFLSLSIPPAFARLFNPLTARLNRPGA